MLIAADQRQAKIALGYIRSMLVDSPVLSRMIEAERKDSYRPQQRRQHRSAVSKLSNSPRCFRCSCDCG